LDRWRTLVSQLPPDYEALATTHKQVQTEHGNAKLRDADTLLRVIFPPSAAS